MVREILDRIFSFIPQIFLEQHQEIKKNRESFLEESLKIPDYISTTKKALTCAINFLLYDIPNLKEDYLRENTFPINYQAAENCLSRWDNFRNILEKYFSKNNNLSILERAMFGIRKMYVKYAELESYIAMQTYMKEDSEYFNNALKMLDFIEEKYHRFRKKCNKRKI